MIPAVVLTRPRGQNGALVHALRARRIPVLEWPGIVVEAEPHQVPRNADVVVFASPNAVRHCTSIPDGLLIAQGPGTARALKQRCANVHSVANPPRSSGVIGAVVACIQPPATVAVVGGDLRSSSSASTLQAHGFRVEVVTVYRNVAPLKLTYAAVPLTAVAYASPSAAKRLIGANPWLLHVPAVAMGPTTADALTDLGAVNISIASEPTDIALAKTIGTLLENS